MIDVGDSVTLTYSSKPASPASVTVTVIAPDGTVTGPTSAMSGSFVFVPAQAGRHTVLWQSTGPADVYSDALEVASTASTSLISLADAKAHLNMKRTDADEELRLWLAVTTELIEKEVGAVLPRTKVEVLGALTSIVLKTAPVISVTSILTAQGADLLPYFVLDGPAGLLYVNPPSVGYPFAYRPYVFPGQPLDRLYYAGLLPYYQGQPVTITYKAGMSPIPAAIQGAARITLADLWESRRGAGPRPARGEGDEVTPPGVGYALPDKAVEMLATIPRTPVVA